MPAPPPPHPRDFNAVKKIILALSLTTLAGSMSAAPAAAQTAILNDLYGRGVHAFYAGHYDQAYEYLSDAINNGIRDPRAYYFRGVVADVQGRSVEAETDWVAGARMEASGQVPAPIGRSMTRIQGPTRLRLESIRRDTKLQYLAESTARAQQRFGDDAPAALDSPGVLSGPPAALPLRTPPAPQVADDPFAGDATEPMVESEDALENAMTDPFADEGPAAGNDGDAMGAPAANPFEADAPAGDDPFGDAGAADPFGGDAGGDDDPFNF